MVREVGKDDRKNGMDDGRILLSREQNIDSFSIGDFGECRSSVTVGFLLPGGHMLGNLQ